MHTDCPERNRSLATLFQSIADLLKRRGENPHRVKAYRRGADTVLGLTEDVSEIARRGELQRLPGIGRDLSAKIEEFLASGTIQTYEQLKTPLPPEIAAWSRLPGLPESIIHHLYFHLGIRTVQDLEMLVRSHLLQTLPGVTGSDDDLLAALHSMDNVP